MSTRRRRRPLARVEEVRRKTARPRPDARLAESETDTHGRQLIPQGVRSRLGETEHLPQMPVTWGFRGAKENRTPDLFHAIHRLIVRGRS